MSDRTIRVLDTTLRDGEQTPGVSLTPQEKLEIAKALDRLGVDVIEAGFPITSKGEQEGIRTIAKAGLRAEICGLARAEKRDIDTAIDCGITGIHVFLASSDIHLEHKLHITREEMLKQSADAVRYAKGFGVKVEFSAEDATRTDIEFFKQVVKAVSDAGIDRFDIPDTVGIATPQRMADYVKAVMSVSDVMISVHCHNDYGLAVANSLAGVVAGADQAHLTINGIGERSGNSSLEEFVMACHGLYGLRTSINYQMLYETSRLVARLTGVVIQPNKAIVGDNAFGHESGIHTHGILSNPSTYEPFDPSMVGRKRWLQAGKYVGRHGIAAQLRGMGLKPKEDSLRLIVDRVKDMGDKGATVTDADLYQIAAQIMGGGSAERNELVELEGLEVVTGVKRLPTATVRLLVRGKLHEATEVGSGSVDAAVNAIQKIFSNIETVRLKEYRLEALTGDSNAVADVTVKVEDDEGNEASGRGMKRDIVVASVEAIVAGTNALLAKRQGLGLVRAHGLSNCTRTDGRGLRMGSTITEKIVSRAAGRKVQAGELIETLPVDKLYFNEVIGPPAILNFQKDFGDVFQESGTKMKVFDPLRVAFMPDHTVPSCSIMVSTGIKLMADFAKQQGIEMYKEGDGIEHTIASEEGFVLPGEITVATDSHTCTQGALGALAFGIGTTEGENLLATGELYSFTVPETVQFVVQGNLQRGVYPKDLVLHVLGRMGEGGCSKRVAEYAGPTIDSMEMDGRFTICNLSVEMSARTAIINPDATTMAYVEAAVQGRGSKISADERAVVARSDPDAAYSQVVEIDASTIEPTVSLPHSPANAKPVSQVNDPINVVFLGSCANARKSDLTVAAQILKGRKVHRDTNLIVIPASRKVYNWAMGNGILNTIAESGANIESSNCGPCFGKHMGILAPGDRCLSTSNRNYRGRMGSPDAFIYLGSPAVAAATAIEGRVADPRPYLGD